MTKKIIRTFETDDYFHVRFRNPSRFTTIRTPEWADKVSDSVSKGSEVRMGRTPAGNWLVEAVLIKQEYHGGWDARRLAKNIVKEIES